MAKRSGAARSTRIDFADYFSPARQVPEPPLPEADRRHYDDLGAVCLHQLTTKGYYAGNVRRRSAVTTKLPAETTVLVVDDDAGTVEIVQSVLGAAGYHTRAARNRAQIAEELCRKSLPDLILLDVVLAPGLSGFNILNKLQQHELLKNIPVIMLTSMRTRENIVKGLGLGATAYLTKPARPGVLLEAVRAALSG